MFYVRFGVTTKRKTTLDKQKIKIKVIKHATTENIVSQRKRARDDERNKFPENPRTVFKMAAKVPYISNYSKCKQTNSLIKIHKMAK